MVDLIDAVEYNAMYTRAINFNRRVPEWARAHGKPVVGNTDLHRLAQLYQQAQGRFRAVVIVPHVGLERLLQPLAVLPNCRDGKPISCRRRQ